MNKFTVYMLVMSGMMLLFYVTGLSTTNPLVNLLLSPENMTSSAFYSTIAVIIAGGAASIILGLFGNVNIKLAQSAIFVPFVIGLLWSFIEVFIVVASVNRPLAVLIFGPLMVVFLTTMYEFYRE